MTPEHDSLQTSPVLGCSGCIAHAAADQSGPVNSRLMSPSISSSSFTLPQGIAEFFRRHPPGGRLCVGYSGGLDSCVLLHLLAGLRDQFSYRLCAIHVHHGLSPRADDWAEHCRRQCAVLDVPLQVTRVEVKRAGQGLEAAARQARYQAFATLAVDSLALAHHRDDQAETVLLQLLRGAGIKGLAAMPESRRLRDILLLRPLLGVARREIEHYAHDHGLTWVDDESNADTRYTRNATRHHLLPRLEQAFPAAAATLARSAGQFAESAQLLDALARLDGAAGEVLTVAQLQALEPVRARNLLRHWLELQGVGIRRERLHEALAQLLEARPDASPVIEFEQASLRRHRGEVRLDRFAPTLPTRVWTWRGEAELDLEAAGALHFSPVTGAGVRLEGGVEIRLRQGGERLQPARSGCRRALKDLLREAGVPPWLRSRLPLLHVDGRLAWVAEIGGDAAFLAGPDQAGWLISWRP